MTPFTTTLTFDGIPLVLAGKRDAEDFELDRVCVAGTAHNIVEHLDPEVIGRIAELADAQLSREAARHAAEDRADALWQAHQEARQAAYDRCPA